MADEWTKVELMGPNRDGDPISFIVASGVKIAKGTLLKGTDLRTAIAHSGEKDYIVGVAAADKAANDFTTRISAVRNAIFQAVASGSITAGDKCAASAVANKVYTINPGSASGAVIAAINSLFCTAMDDATDGQTKNFRINL